MNIHRHCITLFFLSFLPFISVATTKQRISARHTYYTLADKEIHVQLMNVKKMANVDAIVNAANKTLLGKGGLSSSIFMYGGQELLEVEVLKALNGQTTIPVGDARLTPLPEDSLLAQQGNRYIIHAVGPDYRNKNQRADWKHLLEDAYQHSLQLADSHNLESIAFPAIGTSIFGCPKDQACCIAIDTILKYLQDATSIKKVIFFFIDIDDMHRYIELLNTKLSVKDLL